MPAVCQGYLFFEGPAAKRMRIALHDKPACSQVTAFADMPEIYSRPAAHGNLECSELR